MITFKEMVKIIGSLAERKDRDQPFPKKYHGFLPEGLAESVVTYASRGDQLFVSVPNPLAEHRNVCDYIGSSNGLHIYAFKDRTVTESMVKLGGRLGSNPGGKYKDSKTGDVVYKKQYANGEQAKVEALAGEIHKQLGIDGYEPSYSNEDGKHTITTKWRDDVKPSKPSDYENLSKEQADQLATMHHAAVLTKNWDIVGLEHDNVMKDGEGNFSSIDHGGAFRFRAMGDHKNYTPDIDEHSSLMRPRNASGQVFNAVRDQHPTAFHDTIGAVEKLDDEKVKGAFKNSGLRDWQQLHDTFAKRKELLINHYKRNPR